MWWLSPISMAIPWYCFKKGAKARRCCFSGVASVLWNSLLGKIRLSFSLITFRWIKTGLFGRTFWLSSWVYHLLFSHFLFFFSLLFSLVIIVDNFWIMILCCNLGGFFCWIVLGIFNFSCIGGCWEFLGLARYKHEKILWCIVLILV